MEGVSKTSRPHMYKVIVIGGGISGLAAASGLYNGGERNFLLLEAQDRFGGRVHSVNVGSEHVQLGASWIHGVLGNPLYELALSEGLIRIAQTPPAKAMVALTDDGSRVPFQIVQEIYSAYTCFLRKCEEYYLAQYEPPEGILSVGEHLELEIQMYLNSFPPKEREVRRLLFLHLLTRETIISGCDSMKEIDLIELGSFTDLPGGNVELNQGISTLLTPLMRDIPSDMLKMNSLVTQIRWDRQLSLETGVMRSKMDDASDEEEEEDQSDVSGATVISKHGRTPERQSLDAHSLESGLGADDCLSLSFAATDFTPVVEVSTKEVITGEESTYVAEHCIITLPLGVLKKSGASLFLPPLPPYKQEAISRLGFGGVTKIFLFYERPFLHPQLSQILTLWKESSVPSSGKDAWWRKITSFQKMTETLLMTMVSGEAAKQVELLPSEIVGNQCTEILRNFLSDPLVPQPKKTLYSRWTTDPHSLGCHTSIPVGASQADIESLAQPMYSDPNAELPLLVFAGEHTHASFYSTLHGAYLTGRASAALFTTSLQNTASRKTSSRPWSPSTIEVGSTAGGDLSGWIRGLGLA